MKIFSTKVMIPFSKYSGCGNDFILIDNRLSFFRYDRNSIESLCKRCTGIGADGLILLENSVVSDFKMRIFNADGGEAEMCGNGLRCLFKFIQELGFQKSSYFIETMHRTLEVVKSENDVCINMGDPIDMKWNLSIPNCYHHKKIHYLNTGVPHCIIFVDDVNVIDVVSLGKELRYHQFFSPAGTNVNVAALDAKGCLWIRTYERGVENETLACGTGVTAVALAGAKMLGLRSPVKVYTRSQDLLNVSFDFKEDIFSRVTLTGPAVRTFKGFV